MYLVSYPFVVYVLNSARVRRQAKETNDANIVSASESGKGEASSTEYDPIKLNYLISLPRFFFGLAAYNF